MRPFHGEARHEPQGDPRPGILRALVAGHISNRQAAAALGMFSGCAVASGSAGSAASCIAAAGGPHRTGSGPPCARRSGGSCEGRTPDSTTSTSRKGVGRSMASTCVARRCGACAGPKAWQACARAARPLPAAPGARSGGGQHDPGRRQPAIVGLQFRPTQDSRRPRRHRVGTTPSTPRSRLLPAAREAACPEHPWSRSIRLHQLRQAVRARG